VNLILLIIIFILIPTHFKERITPTKLYNAARIHKIIFSFITVVYFIYLNIIATFEDIYLNRMFILFQE